MDDTLHRYVWQAEIRASVYSILQEEEQAKGVHRENKIIREVAESQKG